MSALAAGTSPAMGFQDVTLLWVTSWVGLQTAVLAGPSPLCLAHFKSSASVTLSAGCGLMGEVSVSPAPCPAWSV